MVDSTLRSSRGHAAVYKDGGLVLISAVPYNQC